MSFETFESPINRLGFVLLVLSMTLCLVAFFVTYQSFYEIGMRRIAYLLLDSSTAWQQSVFKFGFFGAVIGAMLAWNFLGALKRIYKWVVKA